MAKQQGNERARQWREIIPGIFRYKDGGSLSTIARDSIRILEVAEALSATGDNGSRDERFIASLVAVMLKAINVRTATYGGLGLGLVDQDIKVKVKSEDYEKITELEVLYGSRVKEQE